MIAPAKKRKNRIPVTGAEARYAVLRMFALKRWETLRNILTQRDHPWRKALAELDDALFVELTLAAIYAVLGELQNAKRYLNRILSLSREEARAQLLYAYVNLIENEHEQALVRYTRLLHHKQFQADVQRILNAIKTAPDTYHLTLTKSFKFFYKHYESSWDEGCYYYGRRCMRFWLSAWGWSLGSSFAVIVILGWLGGWRPLVELRGYFADTVSWLQQAIYWRQLPPAAELNRQLEAIALPAEQARAEQATDAWEKPFTAMKAALKRGDVNAALVHYNKTMQAVPPLVIAEQFNILRTFVLVPQFASFENTLSFATMITEASVYEGTYWKFSGKVAAVHKLSPGDAVLQAKMPSPVKAAMAAGSNHVVLTFMIIAEAQVELLEVFFRVEELLPRVDERYKILMQFVALDAERRPYMQGIAMQRN